MNKNQFQTILSISPSERDEDYSVGDMIYMHYLSRGWTRDEATADMDDYIDRLWDEVKDLIK